MPEWDAEIEVDEVLAGRLIRDSYPELDVQSLQRVGVGWDNTVSSTRWRQGARAIPQRNIGRVRPSGTHARTRS